MIRTSQTSHLFINLHPSKKRKTQIYLTPKVNVVVTNPKVKRCGGSTGELKSYILLSRLLGFQDLSLWGLNLCPPFTGISGPLKRGDKPPQRRRTGAPRTSFQHTSQETHLPPTANLGGLCWQVRTPPPGCHGRATLITNPMTPMAGQAAHDCHFHHTKVIPLSPASYWQM